MKSPYWLRGVKKQLWYFAGEITACILFSIGLWSLDPLKIESIKPDKFSSFVVLYTQAIVSVVLITASVMIYLAGACPRIFQKRGATPFISPLILLMSAVFFSIGTYFKNKMFYSSISFLIVGAILFFSQLLIIIFEEVYGTTLLESITYKAQLKVPILGEKSDTISQKVFEDRIRVNKGDTILAICESIGEGRKLARKIIENAKYGVYITTDRPWTIVKTEFKGTPSNIFCIDLFTNFYGFGEFKEAEKPQDENFYPSTLTPVTIKKLHGELREIRKRIVSLMLNERDWSQLNKEDKKKVEKELVSPESVKEIEINVKIIYDSVSSLASIFNIEDLLKFLIHDTNVDKTIGRNTLLLVEKGILEENIVKRFESFCDLSLDMNVINEQMDIDMKKSRDRTPTAKFSIRC